MNKYPLKIKQTFLKIKKLSKFFLIYLVLNNNIKFRKTKKLRAFNNYWGPGLRLIQSAYIIFFKFLPKVLIVLIFF